MIIRCYHCNEINHYQCTKKFEEITRPRKKCVVCRRFFEVRRDRQVDCNEAELINLIRAQQDSDLDVIKRIIEIFLTPVNENHDPSVQTSDSLYQRTQHLVRNKSKLRRVLDKMTQYDIVIKKAFEDCTNEEQQLINNDRRRNLYELDSAINIKKIMCKNADKFAEQIRLHHVQLKAEIRPNAWMNENRYNALERILNHFGIEYSINEMRGNWKQFTIQLPRASDYEYIQVNRKSVFFHRKVGKSSFIDTIENIELNYEEPFFFCRDILQIDLSRRIQLKYAHFAFIEKSMLFRHFDGWWEDMSNNISEIETDLLSESTDLLSLYQEVNRIREENHTYPALNLFIEHLHTLDFTNILAIRERIQELERLAIEQRDNPVQAAFNEVIEQIGG